MSDIKRERGGGEGSEREMRGERRANNPHTSIFVFTLIVFSVSDMSAKFTASPSLRRKVLNKHRAKWNKSRSKSLPGKMLTTDAVTAVIHTIYGPYSSQANRARCILQQL